MPFVRLLLLALASCLAVVHGTDRYIDCSGGTDSGNCLSGSACRTILWALCNVVTNSDIIYVSNGPCTMSAIDIPFISRVSQGSGFQLVASPAPVVITCSGTCIRFYNFNNISQVWGMSGFQFQGATCGGGDTQGAIDVGGNTAAVVLSDVTITGNGGMNCRAIRVDTFGTLNMTRTTVQSSPRGGIFLYPRARLFASASLITGNTAYNGSGIFVNYFAGAWLTGVNITNNRAYEDGGGLALREPSTLMTRDVRLTGNTADLRGGAIHIAPVCNATVQGALIVDGNIASQSAGGIWVGFNATLVMGSATVTISKNAAPVGGGMFVSTIANVAFPSTLQFLSNTATARGGALFTMASLNFDGNGRFDGNSADYGGVFAIGANADITFTGYPVVSNNKASTDGSFCYNPTFTGKLALSSGVIFCNGTGNTINLGASGTVTVDGAPASASITECPGYCYQCGSGTCTWSTGVCSCPSGYLPPTCSSIANPGVPLQPTIGFTEVTRVNVTWRVPASPLPISNFTVVRSATTQTNYVRVSSGESLPWFVDTGLAPCTTYFYRVMACHSSGCSAFSTAVSTTTLDTNTIAAPSFTQNTNRTVVVQWTATATVDCVATASYVLSSNGNSAANLPWPTIPGAGLGDNLNALQFLWTGLTPGNTYYVRVQACTSIGACVNPSSFASFTAAPTAPEGVSGASILPGSITADQASASWTAPFANGSPILGYRVELTPATGNVINFTPTSTSQLLTGLTFDMQYEMRVYAQNAVGWSSASIPVVFQTRCNPPRNPPRILCGVVGACATLRWSLPTLADSGCQSLAPLVYTSQYSRDSGITWEDDSTRTFTALPGNFTYGILPGNEDYVFRVAAGNGQTTLSTYICTNTICHTGEAPPAILSPAQTIVSATVNCTVPINRGLTPVYEVMEWATTNSGQGYVPLLNTTVLHAPLQVIKTDLTAKTSYSFRCYAAYTSNVLGLKSSELTVTTYDYPGEPTICSENITTTSIGLRCTLPQGAGITPLFEVFEMRLSNQQTFNPVCNVSMPTDPVRCTVNDLTPSTIYTFRCYVGYTTGHIGNPSLALPYATAALPEIPEVDSLASNCTSLTLQCTPRVAGIPITRVELQLAPLSDVGWPDAAYVCPVATQGVTCEHVFTDLAENTLYKSRCVVYSDDIFRAQSAPQQVLCPASIITPDNTTAVNLLRTDNVVRGGVLTAVFAVAWVALFVPILCPVKVCRPTKFLQRSGWNAPRKILIGGRQQMLRAHVAADLDVARERLEIRVGHNHGFGSVQLVGMRLRSADGSVDVNLPWTTTDDLSEMEERGIFDYHNMASAVPIQLNARPHRGSAKKNNKSKKHKQAAGSSSASSIMGGSSSETVAQGEVSLAYTVRQYLEGHLRLEITWSDGSHAGSKLGGQSSVASHSHSHSNSRSLSKSASLSKSVSVSHSASLSSGASRSSDASNTAVSVSVSASADGSSAGGDKSAAAYSEQQSSSTVSKSAGSSAAGSHVSKDSSSQSAASADGVISVHLGSRIGLSGYPLRRNVIFLVSLMIQFAQLAGTAFPRVMVEKYWTVDRPLDPVRNLHYVYDIVSLDAPPTRFALFWVAAALALGWIVAFVVWTYGSYKRASWLAQTAVQIFYEDVMPLLGGALLLPILNILMASFDCPDPVNEFDHPRSLGATTDLGFAASLICGQAGANALIAIAAILIILMYPIALILAPTWRAKRENVVSVFPSLLMLTIQAKFASAIALNVWGRTLYAPPIVVLVISLPIVFILFKDIECSSPSLHDFMLTGYLFVLWAGVAALIGLGINDPTSSALPVVLYVGWAVIIVAGLAWLGYKYSKLPKHPKRGTSTKPPGLGCFADDGSSSSGGGGASKIKSAAGGGGGGSYSATGAGSAVGGGGGSSLSLSRSQSKSTTRSKSGSSSSPAKSSASS